MISMKKKGLDPTVYLYYYLTKRTRPTFPLSSHSSPTSLLSASVPSLAHSFPFFPPPATGSSRLPSRCWPRCLPPFRRWNRRIPTPRQCSQSPRASGTPLLLSAARRRFRSLKSWRRFQRPAGRPGEPELGANRGGRADLASTGSTAVATASSMILRVGGLRLVHCLAGAVSAVDADIR